MWIVGPAFACRASPHRENDTACLWNGWTPRLQLTGARLLTKTSGLKGSNPYHDPELADLYAGFGYDGTYRLLARDLPELLGRHVAGNRALDFACGAGRSTRLLKRLGFETVGIDVSGEMLKRARRRDRNGAYVLIDEGKFVALTGSRFDLVFSAFPFSSTSSFEKICSILEALKGLLSPAGRLFVIEPTPEFYRNEWLSFTTAFPGNETARSGQPVRAAFRERPDQPVIDYLWNDLDYRRAFETAALVVLESHRPLGQRGDPHGWVNESTIPPWVIYVTARNHQPS